MTQFWEHEECGSCRQLEKDIERVESQRDHWRRENTDNMERLRIFRDSLADLMYVGNRLARGDATAEEWQDAVARAIPDSAKPTVCRRADLPGEDAG